jgi:hypothetical protein
MLSEVAEAGGGRQPLPNQLRRGRGQKHLPTVGSSREPRALRALIMEKLSKAWQLIKEAAAI